MRYRSRWSAVVILSCLFVLFLMARQNVSDSHWSFQSVNGIKFNPNKQRRIDGGEKMREGKDRKSSSPKVRTSKDNARSLVLDELRKGFFAAVSENVVSGLPMESVVCVSEPTVLECQGVGFAALLLATLDHVSYCKMLGIHNVSIHWRNCQTSCTKDPRINSWPAYFEPASNEESEVKARKALCLGGSIVGRVLARESAISLARFNTQQIKEFHVVLRKSSLLDVGFRKRQSLPGYEEGAVITQELRTWAHNLITEHARPQSSIQSSVDTFYASHMYGFSVVGVHVRATDHWSENEDKTLPTMKTWIHDTEVVFSALEEPKKIFVASDNNEIIDRFVEHFGRNKVIYTSAIRANNYHSSHPINGEFANHIDPIEIGSQVLIDILLLAKCDHFIHGESSVATLASFFNPDMKLYFIGHVGKDVDIEVDDNSKEEPFPVAHSSEVEKERRLDEKEDGDFKGKPFQDSSEDIDAEWEEGWDQQIDSLVWCFQVNSPYSACPNMARGELIESKDVRTFLAQ